MIIILSLLFSQLSFAYTCEEEGLVFVTMKVEGHVTALAEKCYSVKSQQGSYTDKSCPLEEICSSGDYQEDVKFSILSKLKYCEKLKAENKPLDPRDEKIAKEYAHGSGTLVQSVLKEYELSKVTVVELCKKVSEHSSYFKEKRKAFPKQ